MEKKCVCLFVWKKWITLVAHYVPSSVLSILQMLPHRILSGLSELGAVTVYVLQVRKNRLSEIKYFVRTNCAQLSVLKVQPGAITPWYQGSWLSQECTGALWLSPALPVLQSRASSLSTHPPLILCSLKEALPKCSWQFSGLAHRLSSFFHGTHIYVITGRIFYINMNGVKLLSLAWRRRANVPLDSTCSEGLFNPA